MQNNSKGLLQTLLIFTTFLLTRGCILLLNGWEPIGVGDRALLADIVVTGFVQNTFKNVRTPSDTYSAQFQIFSILKGAKILRTIKGAGGDGKVYNVSNFGDKTMCYADVSEGDTHILFLTTFNGRLSAKYDDIFGAIADYNIENEMEILEALGWKPWSEWSPCSRTCKEGYQSRTRECKMSTPHRCEGESGEHRRCNAFKCKGVKDLLSILSLHSFPLGVSVTPDRPQAFRIEQPAVLNAYTTKLFSRKLPDDFSLLFTLRPKYGNRGYILSVSDVDGTLRLGVQVGLNPTFYFADQNGRPGKASPRFLLNLSDGMWHQMALSVQKRTVTLIYDCSLVITRDLERSHGSVIGSNTVTSLGSLFGEDGKEGLFEGDIEQAVFVEDPDVAVRQCSADVTPLTEAVSDGVDVGSGVDLESSGDGGRETVEGSGTGGKAATEWSEWSPCSVTCGEGKQTRTVFCTDNRLSLRDCVAEGEPKTQSRECVKEKCPVRCPNDCLNGGTCDYIKGECACISGYYGSYCQNVSCYPGCYNGGVCKVPNACTCRPGYRGQQCETAICNPPCQNGGRCLRPGMCACPYGYAPPFCTPMCVLPCLNGGRCIGRNMCRCRPGYTGNQCQTAICDRGCSNGGSCVAPNKCNCRSGYTGSTCQTAICKPPCQNEGVCIHPYYCMCKQGTSGRYCEKYSCAKPCQNGGVCSGPNTCKCKPGYQGRYCQTATCRTQCVNGGRCVGVNRCMCPPGFYGRRCEVRRCKYHMKQSTYARGYRKLERQIVTTRCSSWSWSQCSRPRMVYKMVYRTAYRTEYICT